MSAPFWSENTIPSSTSVRRKVPSNEPRTGSSLVAPATPLPPRPFPSIAEISPATNVPWPTLSVTALPPVSVSWVRSMRPANSGWFTSRPVSMMDTVRVEPPPAAASAAPARTSS